LHRGIVAGGHGRTPGSAVIIAAVGRIPFNRPQLVGAEHAYIDEALARGHLSGNGVFATRCATRLEAGVGARKALITPSCTAALEMAAMLADLVPGDEVIVPSFTFVSTANAFALRGAVPVFVDVLPDTLNIDPAAVEAAVGERTRAVVVVHYGGVACDMDRIMQVAEANELLVIEDAAHALPASYRGRPLGSIGHLATLSFHETKNVQCGEGGALLINDERLVARAEIIQEKGTNRSGFFRGEVAKYTWMDIGSSFLLSEISAAFLLAQLEHIDEITRVRHDIWKRYHEAFEPLENDGLVRRPTVPDGCAHSGHLYYLLLPTEEERDAILTALSDAGVHAVFHYLPLHESPAGSRLGRTGGPIHVTNDVSSRLVRLPLWAGLSSDQVDRVIHAVFAAVDDIVATRV
jgi:dTDP-4-amino-4,6-dideoxygalactose transaminase